MSVTKTYSSTFVKVAKVLHCMKHCISHLSKEEKRKKKDLIDSTFQAGNTGATNPFHAASRIDGSKNLLAQLGNSFETHRLTALSKNACVSSSSSQIDHARRVFNAEHHRFTTSSAHPLLSSSFLPLLTLDDSAILKTGISTIRMWILRRKDIDLCAAGSDLHVPWSLRCEMQASRNEELEDSLRGRGIGKGKGGFQVLREMRIQADGQFMGESGVRRGQRFFGGTRVGDKSHCRLFGTPPP